MTTSYLLAIDQGTTSTRAMVFNTKGQVVSVSQKTFAQHFPNQGWVEHNPEDIWRDTVSVCRDALFQKRLNAKQIAAIGITNQRETTVVWNRETGKEVYPAIVWQDRRTADYCKSLKDKGLEKIVQEKTGLLLDPYFSGTKIHWILENVDGARQLAEAGKLAFGTIDCFLLWHLTGGKLHATDATNASRTLLFNIVTQQWDTELLKMLNIPASMLPEVKDSSADYGHTTPDLFGTSIPIGAIAGDQQAATVGQACFAPGMMKSTYGTGAFMMLNTGSEIVHSKNRLLTTVAYRLNGQVTYALEGSVFIAGAVVQWLRDKMQIISKSAESETLAKSVEDTMGVYFVPAFTGLGSPYWDPHATGMITGLTRNAEKAHIVRAALEAVGYCTRDLLSAMYADGAQHLKTLRVDGGMVANNWMCQFLADILQVSVERPVVAETTALGAAYLAGLQVGVFDSLDQLSALWKSDQRFEVKMKADQQQKLYGGWELAVKQVLTHA